MRAFEYKCLDTGVFEFAVRYSQVLKINDIYLPEAPRLTLDRGCRGCIRCKPHRTVNFRMVALEDTEN